MKKMVGIRLVSIAEEGKGYFFSSLDFIKASHLKEGTFIGGRKSELLGKITLDMTDSGSIDAEVREIVTDCNVYKGSDSCGSELQIAKELGTSSFLRYMNRSCGNEETMTIYTVRDLKETGQ
jgi:hypothetical protein